MNQASDPTQALLLRLHQGDPDALNALIERHLPWIEAQVRRNLGETLRRYGETGDYLHEAIVYVLRHGPRFVVNDAQHCRAILARMVENMMIDRARFFGADQRRGDPAPLPRDSVAGAPLVRDPSPLEAAGNSEQRAELRLALEFLPQHEREVMELRYWQGLDFPQIAQRLGLTSEGVRTRHHRGLQRLARNTLCIQHGRWNEVLAEARSNAPAAPPSSAPAAPS